jgi:glycosyltransferase involved in cell wall biosynthesis
MASWTGVGRYTAALTRALSERGDIEPVLVVAEGKPVPPSLANFERHVASGNPFTPMGAWSLGAALRGIKPELTHCMHFPTPFPAVHPLVVTLHDFTPVIVPGVMPSAAKRAIYTVLNARTARIADAIVVPSRCTADDVTTRYPAARDKVWITPEAVDYFSSAAIGTIPEGLVPKGGRYILSMGCTKASKDLPTLLSAFAIIAESDPGIELLLVGGANEDYVDTYLDGPHRSRVRFTGRVTDAELRGLYAGSAAFAFPSLYEGFGLPPLEAMAFGTPVVVARAASLPEVVGDAALLFEPGDAAGLSAALQQVLSDAALRDRLVLSGRARVAEFSWARTAELTVEAYRAVLR